MSDYTPIPEDCKCCSKCGERFVASKEFFYSDKRATDKLTSSCKTCHAKAVRNWKQNNPQKVREMDRNWNIRNPEKRKAKDLKHYLSHQDQRKEKSRKYRANNHRAVLSNLKSYRERNPNYWKNWGALNRDKARISKQRRRARQENLPDKFTVTDWQRALDYFNGRCAVCGRPPGLWHTIAADHWIPLASPDCPGTIPTNIIPLCHGIDGCNNSKGDRAPDVWLIEFYEKKRGHTDNSKNSILL